MTGSISIRRMQPEELPQTIALWQRSFDSGEPQLRPEQRHTPDEERAFFRDVVATSSEIWLAHEGTTLLGMLALQGDEVDRLYVEPDRKRNGVGSALLAHAKRLQPAGLRLVTLQRNAPACRFYERHGFVAYERGVSAPPESEPDVWYRWPSRPEVE